MCQDFNSTKQEFGRSDGYHGGAAKHMLFTILRLMKIFIMPILFSKSDKEKASLLFT